MPQRPRIADVQCNRLRFEPGDRVIVRVYQPLDRDALQKLRRGVERWAGSDVEVLIVNCCVFDVTVEHAPKSPLQPPAPIIVSH